MSVYKKSFALQANRTILQKIDVGHDRNSKGVQNEHVEFSFHSRQKKSKRRESLNFARNTRLYQESWQLTNKTKTSHYGLVQWEEAA